jgi:hypothetical protein
MKKMLAFSMLFCFIFTSYVFADEPMKRLPKHTFGIGGEIFHVRYNEPWGNSTEDMMSDNGVMGGVVAKYTYHNDSNWMLRADSRFVWGALDYTSDGTGGISNIPVFSMEIRPLLGYDFYSDYQQIVYTLYSGFGYRYWNDQGGGKTSSTGNWGYDRESTYFYIPIGLEAQKDFLSGWTFGASAEFDWLIKGIQKSHLSQSPTGSWSDVTNNQSDGFGVRGGLKIMHRSKNIDVSLEPFVRYWHIGTSNQSAPYVNGQLSPANNGVEPNNRAVEMGADIMFYY